MRTSVSRSALKIGCFVLSMAWGLFALPANGQTVTGKWVAPGRVLDDGEKDRMILDLHQTGTNVTGTVSTIGHLTPVEGTITGNHFELFVSKLDAKPRVVGDLVGDELHLEQVGGDMVAVPAKPEDEYPAIERIAPGPARRSIQRSGQNAAHGME